MTSAPPPPPAAPPPPLPPFTDPPGWGPPPPPSGPPLRPQLRRSRTDKVLGGVNGGLAEYTGIDALLWRVGFVALTLAGGAGVVVYLLLWLLMPAGPPLEAGDVSAVLRRRPPLGPRSPVPAITIAALLILMGAMALFSNVSPWGIHPRGFFGVALLVVGLGLVAAAFSSGRTSRGGLIALGVALSLALAAAASEPWEHTPRSVGDQTFREFRAEHVQPVYRGGVGDFTLDLSGVDVSDLDRRISTRVDAGIGDVDVVLPRSADVRISVDTGLGDVEIFDEDRRSGGYFPGEGTGSWIGDGEPEIDLAIHAGVGDVEVSRG